MFTTRPILATLAAAAGLAVVACSGAGGAVDETAGAEVKSKPVALVQTMDELKSKSTKELNDLFSSPDAKQAMNVAKLPDGAYAGIPLCRKDALPDELPPGVAAVHGANTIIAALRLSGGADNALAHAIWHGKQFYPTESPQGAQLGLTEEEKGSLCHWDALRKGDHCGGVQNFIDILNTDLSTSRVAATAVDFIDAKNQFLVLNYTGAKDSIRGPSFAKTIATELITHVYDTARLVNAEKQIYLGMAWLVDKPGVFERDNTDPMGETRTDEQGRPLTVPSCYFALQLQTSSDAPDVPVLADDAGTPAIGDDAGTP